jgi:hypothetical protein
LIKDLRGRGNELEDQVGANAHVRCHENRNFPRCVDNRSALIRREPGRSDDHLHGMDSAAANMLKRTLGPGEVDQYVRARDNRSRIVRNPHAALCTNQFPSVTSYRWVAALF